MRRCRSRAALAAALPLAVLLTGSSRCGEVVQEPRVLPGFVEPHTPGSGDPLEMAASPSVVALLGPQPDLNRVHLRVTRRAPRRPPHHHGDDDGPAGAGRLRGPPPRVIVILIPGFLGGASTLDPLARDLVERSLLPLEVWAVDRRPNQLEDRLGAIHAAQGAAGGDLEAIPEGAQFYFADTDLLPLGNFPGAEDLDVNEDGVFDPQLPLEDAFGVTRGPLLLAQDDARFMAHWGVDTYMRDWKKVVDLARRRVGRRGVVLLGGHSQGTTWATTFAAYDFDPGAGVVAGHELVDGLLLLEGGGVGPGVATKPTREQYLATVAALAEPGGPEVFLSSFQGIPLIGLGTSGEVSSVAAYYEPDAPALIQRTPVFGSGIVGILLAAPATNEAVVGLFLDDDHQPFAAFRASIGMSDDGPNVLLALPGLAPFYLAGARSDGLPRTWKPFDDPTLPTCPPATPDPAADGGRGCAILDNGPPSDPDDPLAPPRVNGREREVTASEDFLRTQFGETNGFEWYFVSGRVSLDFSYGNDSSGLGDESLLAVTQNAGVDVPVLAIGGSNGLTPEPKSFARYFASIATPERDLAAVILEGYAHLDVINARANEAVEPILGLVEELWRRKQLPRGHRHGDGDD